MSLVYNDFISDRIKKALVASSIDDNIIHDVKGPHMDLDPEEGFLVSLKRTIKVMDENGNTYKITIEEDKD
tara:strand:+ start:232 stop:444 length:213 start_codon:yes stop_codon:yes gene_type:complete